MNPLNLCEKCGNPSEYLDDDLVCPDCHERKYDGGHDDE